MKITPFRLLALICVAAMCTFVLNYLYAGYRNLDGYCSTTQTKLTQEAKIDSAIYLLLRYYPKDREDLLGWLNSPYAPSRERISGRLFPVAYTGVEDFKRTNASCCRILNQPDDPDMPPAGWLDRVMGTKSDFVEIAYKLRYGGEEGEQFERSKKVTYAVTNCGLAWNGI